MSTNQALLAQECAAATSFAELSMIAIRELTLFTGGAEIVCGPISTGGRGLDNNILVFGRSITRLLEQGKEVFSQVPYEEKIFELRRKWQEVSPENNGKYCLPILEEFYRPLFATHRIRVAWFIPGWESSQGAQWERNELTRLGASVCDLDERWVDEMLAQ